MVAGASRAAWGLRVQETLEDLAGAVSPGRVHRDACLGQSPGPAPGRQASLMKRPGAPLPFSSTEGAEADRIRHVAAGLYPQPLVWMKY